MALSPDARVLVFGNSNTPRSLALASVLVLTSCTAGSGAGDSDAFGVPAEATASGSSNAHSFAITTAYDLVVVRGDGQITLLDPLSGELELGSNLGETFGFVGSIVAVAAAPAGGMWVVGSDGGVFALDGSPFLGSVPGLGVGLNEPIVDIVPDPTSGFWLVGADGGVFSFETEFFGSLPGIDVETKSVVDALGTPTGRGYWLLTSNGSVFAFGDAAGFDPVGLVDVSVDPALAMFLDRSEELQIVQRSGLITNVVSGVVDDDYVSRLDWDLWRVYEVIFDRDADAVPLMLRWDGRPLGRTWPVRRYLVHNGCEASVSFQSAMVGDDSSRTGVHEIDIEPGSTGAVLGPTKTGVWEIASPGGSIVQEMLLTERTDLLETELYGALCEGLG